MRIYAITLDDDSVAPHLQDIKPGVRHVSARVALMLGSPTTYPPQTTSWATGWPLFIILLMGSGYWMLTLLCYYFETVSVHQNCHMLLHIAPCLALEEVIIEEYNSYMAYFAGIFNADLTDSVWNQATLSALRRVEASDSIWHNPSCVFISAAGSSELNSPRLPSRFRYTSGVL